MVSEGVDVPRLAVGVYATVTTTPLFFAQAVGRFVRARKRGETASVFLPSTTALLALAAELELQRDHVLGRKVTDEDDMFAAEEDMLAREQAAENASAEEQLMPFQALGSEARFDRVLYDGGEFGHEGEVAVGSEEEMDFLGIPGLLDHDQVRDLLRNRQSERAATQKAAQARRTPDEEAAAAGEGAGAGQHPRAARAAAARAQRAGRRLAPPQRPAARRDPHGAAQGVRRAGGVVGLRGAAAGADRQDPGLGRRPLTPLAGLWSLPRAGSGHSLQYGRFWACLQFPAELCGGDQNRAGRQGVTRSRPAGSAGPVSGGAPGPGTATTSRGSAISWPAPQRRTGATCSPQSRWVKETGGPSGSAR